MTPVAGPAVVIGVGNVLLGDDGVGVRALDALRAAMRLDASGFPAATRLVDGGTLGADLLPELEGARSLVLLDAVDLDQPAGTVSVLRDEALLAASGRPGGRVPGGVGELLAVARLAGRLPQHLALVGVQVDEANAGPGLSGPVAVAVPRAIEAARGELLRLDALAAAAPRRRVVAGRAEGASA